MTRKTSCVTVSTMMTKAPKPRAVPKTLELSPNVPAQISLPTPAAKRPPPPPTPAMETATRREQRQRVFGEHRAAADREAVGLVLELAGGADGADQRVPARDRAAGDGHEEHRPERLPGLAGSAAKPKACDLDRGQREGADDVAAASLTPVSGATTAPTALRPIVSSVTQKPM